MFNASIQTQEKLNIKIPLGMTSITAVLPAHNEEENITEAALQAIRVLNQLPLNEYEIIVIDDGSSDHTAELVNNLRDDYKHIRLIRHPKNLGYGGSLKSGLQSAKGDMVFFTDADLQFNLNELPGFIEALEDCDMVIGYRTRRPERFIRRFNALCWGLLIRLLFGLKVRDIDCAFKLFRRELLQTIHIESIGAFINSEILIRARDEGYKIKEIPVTHFPRKAGKASGARPKVIIRAFKELSKLYRQLKRDDCNRQRNPACLS